MWFYCLAQRSVDASNRVGGCLPQIAQRNADGLFKSYTNLCGLFSTTIAHIKNIVCNST